MLNVRNEFEAVVKATAQNAIESGNPDYVQAFLACISVGAQTGLWHE